MKIEDKVFEMKRELRDLKSTYEQVPTSLILYTYPIDINPEFTTLYHVATLRTEDGTNAIATIEGAIYVRLPFEGGAKFLLLQRLSPDIKLISMQTGTVTVGDN